MELKVSTNSNPSSIAGAITGLIRDGKNVELTCIGAGALNQSIKAIAVSRGFLAPSGINIACIPVFKDVQIDGQNRTGIKLIIKII